MKKLVIAKGLEAVLNNDRTWTCTNKAHRKFWESHLNFLTRYISMRYRVWMGHPMAIILQECGKAVEADEIIDTDKRVFTPNDSISY